MFIEKLFGNTFGIVWLVVFALAMLGLIVWMFVKEDKEIEISDEKTNQVKQEIIKNEELVENKKEEVTEDKKDNESFVSQYEIIESEDGFFRVRKIGGDRTLRKLSTKEEAEEYIKTRG